MKKHHPQHDYYAILGVSKSASLEQIKQAYRQLAIKHHPDKSGDSARIILINEAYTILKDPKKRADYDIYHALHFSVVGKLTHHIAQKTSQTVKQSPVVMANLKKIERHVMTFSNFAEHELRPVLLQNAKILFDKLDKFMASQSTPHQPTQTPNNSNAMPILVITPTIAKHGGQINFTHRTKKIRTTLPKGLADGSKIKLTINGTATWFVIRIK